MIKRILRSVFASKKPATSQTMRTAKSDFAGSSLGEIHHFALFDPLGPFFLSCESAKIDPKREVEETEISAPAFGFSLSNPRKNGRFPEPRALSPRA